MEFIQIFKNYLLALKPAPSKVTVKNYTLDVRHFISWLKVKKQSITPATITLSDIEDFVKESNDRLSTRSLDRHISSLRKFFLCLKLEGIIASSPFDAKDIHTKHVEADPFRLKQFKDFLYVYNASNLTIKNYIIDVKQFFTWAEAVLGLSEADGKETILSRLDNALLEEYRNRLASENVFSYASINRKLSSLRKYVAWANSQNLLERDNGLQINPNTILNIPSTHYSSMPNDNQGGVAGVGVPHRAPAASEVEAKPSDEGDDRQDPSLENAEATYSPFPPFRLAQKISKGIMYVFDGIFTAPLAHAFLQTHKFLWIAKGRPLFTKIQDTKNKIQKISNIQAPISNIPKALYAPLEISTRDFSWYQKIVHHARYTRPNWYKRYHSFALAHYFNWAILIIIMTALGFGFYSSFFQKPGSSQPLLAAASPPRILSFQGRLTDSSNNPITSTTNLRFAIYNALSASGSALLWQEVDGITPDTNGVFSVLLGNSTSIPQSLFANNTN
ncbi:MAG TPA: site-specific integrase, partial [Candidatus Eisenbacteria bacterium]|nr:site-specific integrase [Candidatus Eisenbacteria bacterium]